MIRPDTEELKAISVLANSSPVVVAWLARWRQHEVDKLLVAPVPIVGIAQGRAQALTELCKLLEDAPSHVAGLRKK